MQYTTFCAANSGKGFISFFDTLLDEKSKKIYYIKGGPGCGKSTLMRKIAKNAKDAELILCSGDPQSLDGVLLAKENAIIIDATSPHSHEPKFPGIGGEIIDLGICWEPEKLNKKKIISLHEQKSMLYKACYHFLSSAKTLHEGITLPLTYKINRQKLLATADKILKQNALWDANGAATAPSRRFLSGISPDGRITHSDTFLKLGKNIILLEDRWFMGTLLLQYLDRALNENGIHHINGYHPLFGQPILQHMMIPAASLSIVSKDGLFPLNIPDESVIKTIHMQSFLDKEYLQENKNKLTFLKRMERELLNEAEEKLKEARDLHLKIEQEYAMGCNFSAADEIKEKLLNNLFRNLDFL